MNGYYLTLKKESVSFFFFFNYCFLLILSFELSKFDFFGTSEIGQIAWPKVGFGGRGVFLVFVSTSIVGAKYTPLEAHTRGILEIALKRSRSFETEDKIKFKFAKFSSRPQNIFFHPFVVKTFLTRIELLFIVHKMLS